MPVKAFIALTVALLAGSAHAETPNGLILAPSSVAENQPPGTLVGTLTTLDNDPGDTFTYLLIENPLDAFALNGNRLETAASLDYEAGAQKTVRVRSTDASGAYIERAFTVTVLDRNDPPTGVQLSTTGVPEDADLFALVGTVSQRGDPDQGDAWTFDLIDDAEGRFVLEGNQLRVAAPLDYETDPLAIIEVAVVDRLGATASAVIQLAIWDRNEAPTGVTLTGGAIAENAALGTVVGTLSATGDPDGGDTHTFRVVTADGPFIVDGNTLRVTGALDFEAKAAYAPTLRATDRAGKSVDVVVPVFVSNVNEAPTAVALTGTGVDENAAVGTTVGTLSALDPDAGDTHTFQIVGTASFSVTGNRLSSAAVFDYEATPTVDVTIRATDSGGQSRDLIVSVAVRNKNEAPTLVSLSSATIAESATSNAVVGFSSVADPDVGDTHELLLVADGGGAFRIEGSTLRVAGTLDFERTPSVSITVRARDRAGLFVDASFEITVTDVDEPASGLTVDPTSVRENQPAGTLVGTMTPIGDPDSAQGYTWSIVQNTGNYFAVQGSRLVTTKPIDFEATRSVQIRIRATPPSGAPVEQQVTIDVTDEPEAPTGITISGNVIQEARAEGSFVATLSTTGDPDSGDQHTYSIVENPGGAFTVQGNSLQTAKVLDYEVRALYPIKIRSTDRSGGFVEVAVEMRVLDVNEAPQGVTLSSREIAEGSAANASVGQLGAAGDPDAVDSYTYALVTNPEDRFEILGDTLVARTPFDFEKDPTSYRVTVRVRDQGGLTAETAFLIVVTDVNEAPGPIAISATEVAENALAGTIVGAVTGGVDPDAGDAGVLSVVADSLGGAFTIDAERRLVTARPLDHEAEPSATIVVRQTDRGGLFVEAEWVITIGDMPEAPTGVALAGDEVHENAPRGTIIGALSALGDPDAGDTHTFAIQSDLDGKFAIAGSNLVVGNPLDFEAKATHTVSVSAVDRSGRRGTSTFTITVLDDDDLPTTAVSQLVLPAMDEDDKNPTPVVVADLLADLGASDPEGADVQLRVTGATNVDGQWQIRRTDWAAVATDELLRDDDELRFIPTTDFSGEVGLDVAPFDGLQNGANARLSLTVDAVNDPPQHQLPTHEIEAWQQSPIALTTALGGAIGLVDVDATKLFVTLQARSGTLWLPTNNVTVVSGGVDSGEIVLSGDIAPLAAALTGIVYTPAPRFVGATEILITSDDKGATGSGGARVTTDTISVNVRAAPDLIVSIDDEVVASGATFELGTLGTGAFHVVDVRLDNDGDEDVLLAEALVTLAPEADLDAWVVTAPAARIGPGEATHARIMLRAPTLGPARVRVTIASNDPNGDYTALLSGRAGAASDLHVNDGDRELAPGLAHVVHDLLPAATARFELRLDNLGDARLEVGEVNVVSTTNAEVDIEEPFPLIDAGDDDVLVVYLTPSLPGRVSATLDVPSNDPDMPVFTVTLTGDAVATASPRLVIERVRGTFVGSGGDDVGYGRAGEDVAVALRLVNLGAREAKAPSLSLTNEDNCAARTAVVAEALAPGASLSFSLVMRPTVAGPFVVDLDAGDTAWRFAGQALALDAVVPADALRLYRWGGGRVVTQDLLGPVAPAVTAYAGWSLVNDGPDRVDLALPVRVANLDNIEALPLVQPDALLPARGVALVPFVTTPLAAGAVAFDIAPAGLAPLHVSSQGQIGVMQLEDDAGARIAPDSLVTLPLQKSGRALVLTLYANNTGTGQLELGPPVLDGGPACVSASQPDPASLAPGERAAFQVVIDPKIGIFECSLSVPSNDANRPAYVVWFSVRGARGDEGCHGGPASLAALLSLLAVVSLRRRRHP